MIVGKYDSSLTRVQPFFNQLIDRDPTGITWFGPMLQSLPGAGVMPDELRVIRAHSIHHSSHLAPKGARACFEYPVPPSISFLRWLLSNPDQLHWPKGRAGQFGAETAEWRRRLIDGTREDQAGAMEEGLGELDTHGVEGSRRKPWAFEGWTSVDCCLETERLVVFVEGKRTEQISQSTAWFPRRNQSFGTLRW